PSFSRSASSTTMMTLPWRMSSMASSMVLRRMSILFVLGKYFSDNFLNWLENHVHVHQSDIFGRAIGEEYSQRRQDKSRQPCSKERRNPIFLCQFFSERIRKVENDKY